MFVFKDKEHSITVSFHYKVDTRLGYKKK